MGVGVGVGVGVGAEEESGAGVQEAVDDRQQPAGDHHGGVEDQVQAEVVGDFGEVTDEGDDQHDVVGEEAEQLPGGVLPTRLAKGDDEVTRRPEEDPP